MTTVYMYMICIYRDDTGKNISRGEPYFFPVVKRFFFQCLPHRYTYIITYIYIHTYYIYTYILYIYILYIYIYYTYMYYTYIRICDDM